MFGNNKNENKNNEDSDDRIDMANQSNVGNIKVSTIDKDGKMESFNNIKDFGNKMTLKNNIDRLAKLRMDRNEIIKESNPWTYTVEEAAELGVGFYVCVCVCKTKQNKTTQNKAKQNKAKQNKAKQNKTRPNKIK